MNKEQQTTTDDNNENVYYIDEEGRLIVPMRKTSFGEDNLLVEHE